MNVLYEAIASLHRQVDERIADDATTPCLLSFDRARAVLDALLAYTAQPEQEPVAWEDVLGAIARGWTHDDNKHKTMDVQLAVAIAKEIQDMVAAPPQRKPLTDEMVKRMKENCTSMEMRGAFADGWLSAEAAHGIKGDA